MTSYLIDIVKALLAQRGPVDPQVLEEWRVRKATLETLDHLVYLDRKETLDHQVFWWVTWTSIKGHWNNAVATVDKSYALVTINSTVNFFFVENIVSLLSILSIYSILSIQDIVYCQYLTLTTPLLLSSMEYLNDSFRLISPPIVPC